MKKKILTMCLVAALAATAIVGGTLAYFTDTDKDVNVMTSGNVKIVQNETARDGSEYVDEQALLPAVYLKENNEGKMLPYMPKTLGEGPGGYTNDTSKWQTGEMDDTAGTGKLKIYDDNINNEIDKMISITNTGTLPAYVRTVILVENDTENKIWDYVHGYWCSNDGQYREWVGDDGSVEIDDVTYSVAVCTYKTPLEAGKTTSPSLMQLWLDPKTDNTWYDLLDDGKLNIIAISQAAQTTGFNNAKEALNAAFGEVNAENACKWAKDTNVTVKTTGLANVVGGSTTETP